jgi:paraquat-inducible protein B
MSDRQQIEEQATPAKIQVSRAFSLVWIVPMVALLIGAWLTFQAISEKGPSITISFVSPEGLEAGKTKIKYRDVEIGQVEQITLSRDLSHVVVTAKLDKGSERYLTDKTKFWVVRAQIRGGSVSGLGTFLSGAYIGIDPSTAGKPTQTFTGLEVPPVVTLNQPGRHFRLKADTLGSLNIGAPVYYRQIQVGQVVSYGFGADGKEVDVLVFIEAPHHVHVTENTRFWNASGVDVTLNAQGLKVHTQSMISIVGGGIAFDLPNDTPPGKEAQNDTMFRLYPDYSSIEEKSYSIRSYWMLLFDQSVRGLSVGAPVEVYGIKVGEVINLDLEFDADIKKFQIPVIVAIEPERIRVINRKNTTKPQDDHKALVKWLVEQRGLRAQLQTGNLLTGQLMVNLAFFPESPNTKLVQRDGYLVVPTIPGSFEQLQESLIKIINHIEKVPFDQIGSDLQQVLQTTQSTLKQIGGLAGKLNRETTPQLQATFAELQKTLVDLQRTLGKDSPLKYTTQKTLEELTQTLRSLRDLVDTLENRPQSILFGKEKPSHE